jgi:hypothetical protein
MRNTRFLAVVWDILKASGLVAGLAAGAVVALPLALAGAVVGVPVAVVILCVRWAWQRSL